MGLLSPFLRLMVPLAIYLGYTIAFRHRSDYTGHFLAGCGAALVACEILHGLRCPRRPALRVLLAVVGVVILGVAAEATVFRTARFDPVDMANQSLGSITGGLASEWSDENRTTAVTVMMVLAGFLTAGGGIVVAIR